MFRRNQFGDITRISANPLCYYAMSLWTNMERLRDYTVHTLQKYCRERWYKRLRGRSGTLRPNVEPANRIEQRTKKNPNFLTISRCNIQTQVNLNFIHHFMYFVLYMLPIFGAFFSNFFLRKSVWSFVNFNNFFRCGNNHLISIYDGVDPYNFCRRKGKTRLINKEMDEEMFTSRQSRQFSFIDNMIKVLFPICTLN